MTNENKPAEKTPRLVCYVCAKYHAVSLDVTACPDCGSTAVFREVKRGKRDTYNPSEVEQGMRDHDKREAGKLPWKGCR